MLPNSDRDIACTQMVSPAALSVQTKVFLMSAQRMAHLSCHVRPRASWFCMPTLYQQNDTVALLTSWRCKLATLEVVETAGCKPSLSTNLRADSTSLLPARLRSILTAKAVESVCPATNRALSRTGCEGQEDCGASLTRCEAIVRDQEVPCCFLYLLITNSQLRIPERDLKPTAQVQFPILSA